jgi:hypothetical protein
MESTPREEGEVSESSGSELATDEDSPGSLVDFVVADSDASESESGTSEESAATGSSEETDEEYEPSPRVLRDRANLKRPVDPYVDNNAAAIRETMLADERNELLRLYALHVDPTRSEDPVWSLKSFRKLAVFEMENQLNELLRLQGKEPVRILPDGQWEVVSPAKTNKKARTDAGAGASGAEPGAEVPTAPSA